MYNLFGKFSSRCPSTSSPTNSVTRCNNAVFVSFTYEKHHHPGIGSLLNIYSNQIHCVIQGPQFKLGIYTLGMVQYVSNKSNDLKPSTLESNLDNTSVILQQLISAIVIMEQRIGYEKSTLHFFFKSPSFIRIDVIPCDSTSS